MDDIGDITQARLRIFALTVLAVLVVLTIRLWFLQGVQGQEFKRLSEDNRIKQIAIHAPRGQILDRNAKPIVSNRPSIILTIEPEKIDNDRLLEKVAKLLQMDQAEVTRKARSQNVNPIEPRIIKQDISPEVVAYFAEHKNEYIGVELEVRSVRAYPLGNLAAHLIGYLGELSEQEKEETEFAGYDLGDLVGKVGVEREYEDLLAGDKGTQFVEVNAAGQLLRVIDKQDAIPGNNIILTLDADIQASAEKALVKAIARANRDKFPRASAGAIVVMKPKGEILAMVSYPTFDPEMFIGGISQANWSKMIDEKNDYPLNNRAIMSSYPPGSTFKLVSAIAGLKTGVISTGTTFVCRGRWFGLGKNWGKWCWDRSGHGRQSLEGALRISCDTYFYEVGNMLYKRGKNDLQRWARRLGVGSKTGIDLPSEVGGRVPTPAWKKELNKTWVENQQWFPGDTVNMAIGQGDLLATPLQVANMYAALVNDGVFYKPHVVKTVKGLEGRSIYSSSPKKERELDLSQNELNVIKRGLRRVTIDGTAKGIFTGLPVAVSGKTGTSEVAGKDDYALFVAYAPAEDPKYIISIIVEQGGHGGPTAAPAAREILEDIYSPSDSDEGSAN